MPKLDLQFFNDPEPTVDVLAVIWPAGDPFTAQPPSVVGNWLKRYDARLEGRLWSTIANVDFRWHHGSHLLVETNGALPFPTLLLHGATPPGGTDWPGWTAVGAALAALPEVQRANHLGILIDRIFAPGLEELAAGLYQAAKPPWQSLQLTGSLRWTPEDHQALIRRRR